MAYNSRETIEERRERNARTSQDAKLLRAIQLKMRGLTDQEISNTMIYEGYRRVSQRTINRLLNSTTAQEMADELLAQQLRDITTAEQPLRLKYRDKILEKLIPKTPFVAIQQNLQSEQMEVGVDFVKAFQEHGDVLFGELLRRQLRGSSEDIPENNTE